MMILATTVTAITHTNSSVWRESSQPPFVSIARAVQAQDDAAKTVEIEAIADRIRRMLYVHMEIRIGMSSDDWVWLDSQEDVEVELTDLEMNASGRILCT